MIQGKGGRGMKFLNRAAGVALLAVLFSGAAGGGLARSAEAPAVLLEKKMVFVPAGKFTMGTTLQEIEWVAREFGSESHEWYLDETPAREVQLEGFYIDEHEVTFIEYMTFVDLNRVSPPKLYDNPRFNGRLQPVVGIGWEEADAYCRWVGKRLPSEAEWEKAARGADGRRYPWGSEPDASRVNHRGMMDNYRYTAPVGDFPEGNSPYGAMDMAGNVWEWTADWYKPYPGNQHASDLYGEKLRVIRGGSWSSNMDLARTSVRGKAAPDQRQDYIGFRCAKNS